MTHSILECGLFSCKYRNTCCCNDEHSLSRESVCSCLNDDPNIDLSTICLKQYLLASLLNITSHSQPHVHLHPFSYLSITVLEKKYAWLHPRIFAVRFLNNLSISSSQHHQSRNPPLCCRTPRCVRTVISGCSLTIIGCGCGPSSAHQCGCRVSCAGRPGANDSVWCRKICCTASRSPPQYWWEEKTLQPHRPGYVLYRTAAYCPCRNQGHMPELCPQV